MLVSKLHLIEKFKSSLDELKNGLNPNYNFYKANPESYDYQQSCAIELGIDLAIKSTDSILFSNSYQDSYKNRKHLYYEYINDDINIDDMLKYFSNAYHEKVLYITTADIREYYIKKNANPTNECNILRECIYPDCNRKKRCYQCTQYTKKWTFKTPKHKQ